MPINPFISSPDDDPPADTGPRPERAGSVHDMEGIMPTSSDGHQAQHPTQPEPDHAPQVINITSADATSDGEETVDGSQSREDADQRAMGHWGDDGFPWQLRATEGENNDNNQVADQPVIHPISNNHGLTVPVSRPELLHAMYGLRIGPRADPPYMQYDPVDNDDSGTFDLAEQRRIERSKAQKKRREKARNNEYARSPDVVAQDGTDPDTGGDNDTETGTGITARTSSDVTADAGAVIDPEDLDELLQANGYESDEPPEPNDDANEGCISCLRQRIRCSLLDNEFGWPCDQCSEKTRRCVLVKPPVHRHACEGCLKEESPWLVCSHLWEKEPRETCYRCEQLGKRCIAGPSLRHIIAKDRRDGFGNIWKNTKPRLRAFDYGRSCKACQLAGRTCSHRGNDLPVATCTACEANGIVCESFSAVLYTPDVARDALNVPDWHTNRLIQDDEDRRNRRRRRRRSDMAPENKDVKILAKQQARETADELDHRLKDVDGKPTVFFDFKQPKALNFPSTRKYVTKFCHPIEFNVAADCSFCLNAEYQFYGLGEKTVQVDVLPDGQGLHEYKDGHAEDGSPNTKLCESCTDQRIKIIMCFCHELQQIEHPTTDENRAMYRLSLGVVDKWCSICFNLAEYECCTEQIDGSNSGCGLKVCNECARDLVTFGNSLGTCLLTVREHTSEMRPHGWRADWELLKQQGLLASFCKLDLGPPAEPEEQQFDYGW